MNPPQQNHTQAENKLDDKYLKVPLEAQCDLVMKGGIASGVLYPPAILEIAKEYRFHEIGGTSAGAIAAAAAAAAEYGRATTKHSPSPENPKGFARLEELQVQLAEPGFVFNLFQPSNNTAPLFHLALALKDWYAELKQANQGTTANPATAGQRTKQRGWLPYICAALHWLIDKLRKHTPTAFQQGSQRGARWGIAIALAIGLFTLLAVIGLGLTLRLNERAIWIGMLQTVFIFGVVLGAIAWRIGSQVGGVIGSASELLRSAQLLADGNQSFYGICSGHHEDYEKDKNKTPLALTDWLTENLNLLAGLPGDEVLTFGHLREKDIGFRLVTTNLSEGQPYVLPLKEEQKFDLIFCEADMQKLFPKEVVNFMVNHQPVHYPKLPDGYYFLPKADDLPVVVATRMSLSFPILLSAVRLYKVKRSAYNKLQSIANHPGTPLDKSDLVEHWFSDGGITSNFPIHMFDTWYPVHPTFGIKLHGWLSPTPEEAQSPDKDQYTNEIIKAYSVYLPPPGDHTEFNGGPIRKEIKSLRKFFGQILDTMQNHHDNAQSMLPGYRERIVQVYLENHEGGLNLNMPQCVIDKLIEKGTSAGRVFTHQPDERYLKLPHFDLAHHQWVRFRVLMAQLEREVAILSDDLSKLSLNAPDDATYERLIEIYGSLIDQQLKKLATRHEWYKSMNADECQQATERIKDLWSFIKPWKQEPEDLFRKDAPTPNPVLRLTPEL